LWVSVSTEEPCHILIDMPIFRPSDTWFGPTNNDGELCYASRTFCRLRIEDVPFRPHRCVSAVKVRNLGDTDLPLERLKLPVNTLAVHIGDDNRLWTQDVILERREGMEYAQLTISEEPPALTMNPRLLAKARTSQEGSVMTRAFSTLLS
jgi:hypothetical protein